MTTGPEALDEALFVAATAVSAEEAKATLRAVYGIDGAVAPLPGEKDSNFRVDDGRGSVFLLKFAHPAESPAVSDLHARALLHVAARDPGLPVQRVVPTREGGADAETALPGQPRRRVRLVTFLDGLPQSRSPTSVAQRRKTGAALARLQAALAGFAHPGADHASAWDLKHAGRLRALLAVDDDSAERRDLETVLDRFDADIAPRLASLRRQVVHNDFNRDNLLVDAADPTRVRGILDFGDAVSTPVALDVAVGAAYQLHGEGAFDGALDFLAGFDRVRPLEAVEVALMPGLIATRTAQRILISRWRAARFPENAPYLLRNVPAARDRLRRLLAVPPDRAIVEVSRALGRHEP